MIIVTSEFVLPSLKESHCDTTLVFNYFGEPFTYKELPSSCPVFIESLSASLCKGVREKEESVVIYTVNSTDK